ncbi:MAG: protein kinase, partial [Gammaproteobacteria bacterium]|nr:protein kinase [Gammaproteobacteria bacterium]
MSNIPAKIGKYDIIKEVGRGSTGSVYLSHDPFYRRDVAIKLYDHEHINDEEADISRKMFFNEANMVGMLQHPNILPIYDAGEEEGHYYVVMEHVQGARTLSAYCSRDNLLPVEDVVEITFKCAKALHYAHGRGVVHRDVKPSNIMLTPDSDVRIIDFGIAQWDDADHSQIRGIAGSPSYMSPEQVQSHEITHRSDLYSLGAVMFELLTGVRPFRAPNLAKLLQQIVNKEPKSIREVRDDLPEVLELIVGKALQKEPDNRFNSGLDMATELTRAFQQLKKMDTHTDSRQERFDRLRKLRFFHDFSHAEIWEVLKASDWHVYEPDEEIVKEGEMDDRFYILIEGRVKVIQAGMVVGYLDEGDCFGESSYVRDARRN